MSVWSSISGFFVSASSDVDSEVKAILADADTKVAAVKAKHAAAAAQAATQTNVQHVKATAALIEKWLAEKALPTSAVSSTTGASGPTGPLANVSGTTGAAS